MNLGYLAQWQAILGPILGEVGTASSGTPVAGGLPLDCPHSGCISVTACGDEVTKWCDCAFPASVDSQANTRCKMGLGMSGGVSFCLLEPPWMGGGARTRNIPGPADLSAIGCFALDPLNLFGSKTSDTPGYKGAGGTGSQVPGGQQQQPSYGKYVLGAVAVLIGLLALRRRPSPPPPSPTTP